MAMSFAGGAVAGPPNLESASRIRNLLWLPGESFGGTPTANANNSTSTAVQIMTTSGLGTFTGGLLGNTPVGLMAGAIRLRGQLDHTDVQMSLLKSGVTSGLGVSDPVNRQIFRMARVPVGGSTVFDQNFGFWFVTDITGGFPQFNANVFGIVGDGLGGWQFLSKVGGVIKLATPIVWPSGDTVLTDWEFRFTPATKDTDGKLEIFANGTLITSVSFGSGNIVKYSDVNRMTFQYTMGNAGGTVTDQLAVAAMRFTEAETGPA
jgi:hypothetical protein